MTAVSLPPTAMPPAPGSAGTIKDWEDWRAELLKLLPEMPQLKAQVRIADTFLQIKHRRAVITNVIPVSAKVIEEAKPIRQELAPAAFSLESKRLALLPESSILGSSSTAHWSYQSVEAFSPAQLQALVVAGCLEEANAFAAAASCSPAELSSLLMRQRIFFIQHKGKRVFPMFFLDSRYERKDLEKICISLKSRPGQEKLQFFLQPQPVLGNLSPLQALIQGKRQSVQNAACAAAPPEDG